MATRGIYGFVIDGREKLTYNHSDSYPAWLGMAILEYLRGSNIDSLRQEAEALRMVSDIDTPSESECRRLGEGEIVGSWYDLLGERHGDLRALVEGGVMIDDSLFAQDSLFCEWGYVVDLDSRFLEIYRGFQTEPHRLGRFSDRPPVDAYYPIALISAYSLLELPTPEVFLEQIKSLSKEDDA